MALPNIFAAQTTPQLVELDQNFTALGKLTPVPGVVAGTNALTLTPGADTPTVAAFSNYQQFTGIAAQTNSGSVTVAVGGLTPLIVYKDTLAGPVVLTGGEIVQHCAFSLLYDSALTAGAGGFHLQTGGALLIGQTVTLAALTVTGIAGIATLNFTGGTIGNATVTGLFTAATLKATGASITTATVTGILTGTTITANIATLTTLASTGATISTATIGALLAPGASIALATINALRINTTTTLNVLAAGTITITHTVVPANTTQDQTATLAGVVAGNALHVTPPASVASGLMYMGYIPANGTVSVRCANVTAASIVPPTSQVFQVADLGFV